MIIDETRVQMVMMVFPLLLAFFVVVVVIVQMPFAHASIAFIQTHTHTRT